MSEVDRKDKKKSKKERREKDEAAAVVEEEVATEEEKKEKKEKKDKKRKAEEITVEETEPVVEEEKKSKKEKKDKKEKKEKKNKDEQGVKASTSSNADSRYKEHSATAAMPLAEVASTREGWKISLYPSEEAEEENNKPITQFEYLRPSVDEKCPYIMRYIASKGFAHPSPIQVK